MRKIVYRSLDHGTHGSIYDALHVLEQLINEIIARDFKGDMKLKTYVKKRFDSARDVLKRRSRDHSSQHELHSMIPSARALRNPPRHIKVKTLDGGETSIHVGVPDDEAFYSVRVSRYRLKCTCQDALMQASTANSRFKYALLRARIPGFPTAEPFFYKYVLCKHVLAKLAEALGTGTISIDEELLSTLRIALYTVYLRTVEKPDPDITRRIYPVIKRRI